MMFKENRSGQPEDAIWYPQIVSEDGQERRHSEKGISFWCKELQAKQCSRSFNNLIEGKKVTVILGSNNHSKLIGLDKDSDARVLYNDKKYKVTVCDYDKPRGRYTIALT